MEQEYDIARVARAFGLSVSALRYYDDIGLVPCARRRGGVRVYDRAALERLAYVRMWHEDAMLPLARTRALVEAGGAAQRHRLIAAERDELRERAARMSAAADVLDHLLGCPADAPLDCPETGRYLREQVDRALAHGEAADPPRP